jgi:hypothetical protein
VQPQSTPNIALNDALKIADPVGPMSLATVSPTPLSGLFAFDATAFAHTGH